MLWDKCGKYVTKVSSPMSSILFIIIDFMVIIGSFVLITLVLVYRLI